MRPESGLLPGVAGLLNHRAYYHVPVCSIHHCESQLGSREIATTELWENGYISSLGDDTSPCFICSIGL